MKVKTIRKTIETKLRDWIDTIDNKDALKLNKDVEKNLIVTGGCITSMFLNEQVNDFDIYIQDMDVLIRLAQYYCPSKVLDGRKRDEYISDRWEEEPDEDYVAEEYIRIKNLKYDQVKLDIPSIGESREVNEDKLYQPKFLSQNAISLTGDIQIVLRFNGTPEQIHKTFDFIHATNYFTFKDGLVTNINALECILTKELKYQGSQYPLTSIIRMKKFIQRGWTINAGEMLKIMFQISLLNLTNIETLEEQLIGIDVAYFGLLIDTLRGVDTTKINSYYINKIIDRVFNQSEEEV